MKALRIMALGAALSAAAAPVYAQGVDGTWHTEIERMMRNENGNVSGGEKAQATIVLQQKGDSVFGTFEVMNPSGNPGRKRELKGTFAAGKLSLSTEFEATVNINGEESTRKVTTLYDLTLNGDKLEGTTTTRSNDMDMPPRPFVATRAKQ